MLELCLLPLLSLPQEPTPPAAPVAESVGLEAYQPGPERWLGADTLFALVLAPIGEERQALARTGAAMLWRSGAFDGARAILADVAGQVGATTGLGDEQLLDTLLAGCAFGCRGVGDDGTPDLTAVLTMPPTATALRELVQTWQQADGSGATPWRVRLGPLTLYGGVQGDQLALGTTADGVATTLQRVAEGGGSLADEATFVACMRASAPTGHRLLTCYVAPHAVLDRVQPLIGDAPWLQPLRQQLPTAAFATWLHAEGRIHSWARLQCEELHGLLDALAGTRGRLTADWSRFVPPDAQSCLFAAVDLGAVVGEAIDLLGVFAPDVRDQVMGQFEQLRARCGADLQHDLLQNLADTLAVIGWEREGRAEFAIRLQVDDSTRAANMLTALVPMSPVPFEAFECEGNRAWRMPATGDGSQPAFALVGDALWIAGHEQALAAAIRQQQNPAANALATTLLDDLPPAATWASLREARTELAALALPGLTDLAAPAAEGLAGLSPGRSVVVREEHGVRTEQSSGLGGAWLLAALQAVPRTAEGSTTTTDAPGPDDITTLQRAEAAGKDLDADAVIGLLAARNAEVVARAAWLLGKHRIKAAVAALGNALATRSEVEVRLQAIAALSAIGDASAQPALLEALADASPQVRALAAKGLARQRARQATAGLLAMLDQFGREMPTEQPVDLVAALLALHDLGEPGCLLPAASAVAIETPATGQALTYLFQQLSPKLAPKDEVTTLVAVLDHQDRTLRRYAIQRLGELREPTTAASLERRLAVEGPELQPLVRVSLAQVRGEVEADGSDLLARAGKNAAAIGQMVQKRWSSLGDTAQWTVLGLAGTAGLGLVALLFARRRRADRAAADEAAHLVTASDEVTEASATDDVGMPTPDAVAHLVGTDEDDAATCAVGGEDETHA